jgi:hypothetical protein
MVGIGRACFMRGSTAATRRASSLRCLRVIRPPFNRSKVDILGFLMPYSLSLNLGLDSGSARLAKIMQTLHRGRAGPLCKAGPPPINTSREAEVMLRDGLKGTRHDATIACRLSLYPLKRNSVNRNPGSRRVSRSIHRPRRRHAARPPDPEGTPASLPHKIEMLTPKGEHSVPCSTRGMFYGRIRFDGIATRQKPW